MTDETNSLEGFIKHLQEIRATQGEAAFQAALKEYALDLLDGSAQSETFLGGLLQGLKGCVDLDLEALKAEKAHRATIKPPSFPTDRAMLEAIQQQMPCIKTQAQLNCMMACMDALRATLEGYFTGKYAPAEMSREALGKALDMAKQTSRISEQLEELPEDQRSAAAKEFTESPREFREYDVCRSLISELALLGDNEAFGRWYSESKERRDLVVSQSLRDELYDAIRNRRRGLS